MELRPGQLDSLEATIGPVPEIVDELLVILRPMTSKLSPLSEMIFKGNSTIMKINIGKLIPGEMYNGSVQTMIGSVKSKPISYSAVVGQYFIEQQNDKKLILFIYSTSASS